MKGVFYCCAFKANWAVAGKNSSVVEGCYCVGIFQSILKALLMSQIEWNTASNLGLADTLC